MHRRHHASIRLVRWAAVAAGTGALTVGLLAAPAAATSTRVPPWPSVSASVPTSLLRPATTTTPSYLSLAKTRLAKRVNAAALGSNVSVRVEDLETGALVFDHRGGARMTPASTMKTATALAVLSARGPEHQMSTRLMLDAETATLTLVGAGDPLLSSDDLNAMAQAVATKLIARGDGDTEYRLTFDDSLFETPRLPAGWPSSYFYNYAARPTALIRDGRRTSDGGVDCAKYTRKRLKAHGLDMAPGVTRGAAAPDATQAGILTGHTIAQAVWPMLQYSDNTIAEILLRHVALGRGVPATTDGSAAAVKAELRELGVPVGRMTAIDGSGLSRSGKMTTRTLVAITRASLDPADDELATGFRTAAYPIAGSSGTLASRFKARNTSCVRGRLIAKTGTLTGTTALSGITASTDGRIRAFAIVADTMPSGTSSDEARYRVDRIAAAITGCR